MSTGRRIAPRRRWLGALLLALAIPSLALVVGSGCATVPAYRRERLVDPIMSFETEAKRDARMMKALEAREGSTGGTGGAGGGCACN